MQIKVLLYNHSGHGGHEDIWIAATRASHNSSTWTWLDGTVWTHALPMEASNNNGETCARINPNKNSLVDAPCDIFYVAICRE